MVPPSSSYVLMPSAPESIANCGYPSQGQGTYVVSSPPPQTYSPPPQEPETQQPGPEEAGTCKIAMVKHCDLGKPQESPEIPPLVPSTIAPQTVQVPPPQAITVIAPPPLEQQVVTLVTAEAPRVTLVTPVPEQQRVTVISPQHEQQRVPQMFPSLPPQGQQQQQQQQQQQHPQPSVPSTVPGTTCGCSSAPQIPNPSSGQPINITGNGYPVSNGGYNPNLGQISPCTDVQRMTPQCEMQRQNEKTNAQFSSESCSNPTPTVIINGSEYLVGPSMYSALNSSPCGCSCS